MRIKITLIVLTIFFLTQLLFLSCKNNENTPSSLPHFITFKGTIGSNDNSTCRTSDSNLIICGTYNYNFCILKLTKNGNLIWRKDLNVGEFSDASGIVETEDHNFLICGRTLRNHSISLTDAILIKINSEGDTLWTKTYGYQYDDYGMQIIRTKDENYLISGYTESGAKDGLPDIYLIKVNPNGDTLWTSIYRDPKQEVSYHLLETKNGEFLITGTNEDNDNGRELYLLKVSSGGEKLWDKKFGPVWKWGYCTLELSNGDLITCGLHGSGGRSQVLLLKTDHLGNKYWEKEYGEIELSDCGYSIKQNSDNSFTITGSAYSLNTTKQDVILLKVDQSGSLIWLKKFGGANFDWGYNLIKDNNDDNIITGTINSFGDDLVNGSIFFIKTDSNGGFK
jgi:hypothetical protein